VNVVLGGSLIAKWRFYSAGVFTGAGGFETGARDAYPNKANVFGYYGSYPNSELPPYLFYPKTLGFD